MRTEFHQTILPQLLMPHLLHLHLHMRHCLFGHRYILRRYRDMLPCRIILKASRLTCSGTLYLYFPTHSLISLFIINFPQYPSVTSLPLFHPSQPLSLHSLPMLCLLLYTPSPPTFHVIQHSVTNNPILLIPIVLLLPPFPESMYRSSPFTLRFHTLSHLNLCMYNANSCTLSLFPAS